MTLIENDSPKVQYTGPFVKGQLLPLTFPYIATEDVKMIIDDELAVFNVDYEIITEPSDEHPVAYPNSAYIKNDLPNAQQITLYRATPLDQQAPFPQNAKFRSERMEQALDKLTMQQQEQEERFARCLKVPVTAVTEFEGTLPPIQPNKALKFNADGTGFETSEFDPDQAMLDTEHFKNQAIEAADKAQAQAQIAEDSAQIATDKMEEITVTHAEYMEELTELGDKVVNDADAIVNRVGLSMFDTVIKDHILTYEESKGLALQGTYVYKDAIPGEEYGYPDFYAKCLEEYKTSTIIHTSVATDIDWVHPSTVTDYAYSGIRNFYEPEFNELFGENTGSLVFNDAESYLEWGLGENVAITGFTITMDCFLEEMYNTATASLYSVDENGMETLIATGGLEEVGGMNVRIYHSTAVCDGVVANRLRLRMNGTSVKVIRIEITAKETDVIIANQNGHVFYDITLKSQVDDQFASTGIAWMYGIDTENERIFLPRNSFLPSTGRVRGTGKSVGLESRVAGGWMAVKDGAGSVYVAPGVHDTVGSTTGSPFAITSSASHALVGVSRSAATSGLVSETDANKYLYICVGNQVTGTASIDIVTQVHNGVKDIEEARQESIEDIEEARQESIEVVLEASELAKDWATSEVIVDNIDYSAKYWAEKAKDNSGIYYDELVDEDVDVEVLDGKYVTLPDFERGLNTKQDKGDYATRTELYDGLDTKQARGNYALKSDLNSLATKSELPTQVSELENDSNFATQTQVMQAIASIPQFSLSIVNELPATGEKMTLYLVPKEGTNNDVYDEYIWIEQTSSFEHLGTTAVDLTDYVKKTDYASTNTYGVVKVSSTGAYGIGMNDAAGLYIASAIEQQITAKTSSNRAITPAILDFAVKTSVTTNTIELTDDEKTSARTWLGAVGDTDYATSTTAGVIKAQPTYGLVQYSGILQGQTRNLESYNSAMNSFVVCKGTLNNVLTQYSKTVLTTEADYNALATKDANTLYLIEE